MWNDKSSDILPAAFVIEQLLFTVTTDQEDSISNLITVILNADLQTSQPLQIAMWDVENKKK